jgi:L-alanine-DL-glutamate epimerase-like enolase superfamily enzyme
MADDLLEEPLLIENGSMRVPDGPGLGIRLDPEKVARYRLDL